MYYHERNLRTISELAPNTKKKVLEWYKYCQEIGAEILIYDARRTVDEQRENVRKGVSGTMKSYHLVGQAIDFVPASKTGAVSWNWYERSDIVKAVKHAKKLGFVWGGDWKNFIDKPHLQYEYKGYGTDEKEGLEPAPSAKPKPVGDGKAIVPYPGKPLYMGATGKDVERIQRAVGVTVTKRFDSNTDRAVRAYQKRKGLTVDGVVGVNTWNMMF